MIRGARERGAMSPLGRIRCTAIASLIESPPIERAHAAQRRPVDSVSVTRDGHLRVMEGAPFFESYVCYFMYTLLGSTNPGWKATRWSGDNKNGDIG